MNGLVPEEAPPEEALLLRDRRRSRRKRVVRARTISTKRMSKRELEAGRLLYPERPGVDYQRPQTRAECADGPRPCPFVSCRHHLYLDVHPDTGAIKLNFPDLEVEDLGESCSLDLADQGGVTLEVTGELLNMTRERVRQLELLALAAVKTREATRQLAEFQDPDNPRRVRLPLLSPAPTDDTDEEEMDVFTNPKLIRELVTYCASVENGAKDSSIWAWCRVRGLTRAQADALLVQLQEELQLVRVEVPIADGSTVVRYRAVDPTKAAPLPTSDAPPAERSAAPAHAPETTPEPPVSRVQATQAWLEDEDTGDPTDDEGAADDVDHDVDPVDDEGAEDDIDHDVDPQDDEGAEDDPREIASLVVVGNRSVGTGLGRDATVSSEQGQQGPEPYAELTPAPLTPPTASAGEERARVEELARRVEALRGELARVQAEIAQLLAKGAPVATAPAPPAPPAKASPAPGPDRRVYLDPPGPGEPRGRILELLEDGYPRTLEMIADDGCMKLRSVKNILPFLVNQGLVETKAEASGQCLYKRAAQARAA